MTTLANCRLTEETLERFAGATRRMIAALADPPVHAELQRQDEDTAGEADRVRSVAGIASRFERVPALHDAIGAEGMTPKEYVVVQVTLFQSTVAATYLEAEGSGGLTELPKGTSQENVDFVRAHRDRISQLTAELRRLTAAPSGASPQPDASRGVTGSG